MHDLLVSLSLAVRVVVGLPNEREITNALLALNNHLEAVRFSDACTGDSQIVRLALLEQRIDAARAKAAVRVPRLAASLDAGDTDYVCSRVTPVLRTSPRALKRQTLVLFTHLEDAVRE